MGYKMISNILSHLLRTTLLPLTPPPLFNSNLKTYLPVTNLSAVGSWYPPDCFHGLLDST